MKFLIIGLGNPGSEYESTRHNIGFMVLDALAKRENIRFSNDKLGLTAEYSFKGRNITLLKPSTFMNLSGKSVMYHMMHRKLDASQIMVVTDDLALPFGTLRLKGKGSHGGHNGLRNIQELLGNDQYPRMRIGIGNQFSPGKQVDYVLNDFNSSEMATLPLICDLALKGIDILVHQGIDHAMTWLNGRFVDVS